MAMEKYYIYVAADGWALRNSEMTSGARSEVFFFKRSEGWTRVQVDLVCMLLNKRQ